jgi:hypothetical protein
VDDTFVAEKEMALTHADFSASSPARWAQKILSNRRPASFWKMAKGACKSPWGLSASARSP